MEQQAGVVAAGEALRTWVVVQRTTWTDAPPPRALAPAVVVADAVPAEWTPDVPMLRLPEPVTSVYVTSPARGAAARQLARAAVVLAVAGVVGAGGYAAWQRHASAPRTGTAVIETTPAGAEVVVDGTAAGTTPARIALAAGNHAIELRLKGVTRTRQVTIARGADTQVSVDWTARRVGSLQVASTPTGARVLVDGRERGVTPLELHDLTAGAHVVQLESAEGTVRRRVDVSPDRPALLSESIFPGWVHVSAPFEVTVMDGARGLQLDSRNLALAKPGSHTLRIENRALAYVESRTVLVQPGETTDVILTSPTSTLSVTGPAGAALFIDGEPAGHIPLEQYPVKLGLRDVMMVETSGGIRHASVTVTSRPATVSFIQP